MPQALDVLTPLGRGQALLVTGLRQTGKTSLVLDAILGQYRSGVRCIYAAIGQRFLFADQKHAKTHDNLPLFQFC